MDSIEILFNSISQTPAESALKELAISLNIGVLSDNGSPLNTRQQVPLRLDQSLDPLGLVFG